MSERLDYKKNYMHNSKQHITLFPCDARTSKNIFVAECQGGGGVTEDEDKLQNMAKYVAAILRLRCVKSWAWSAHMVRQIHDRSAVG